MAPWANPTESFFLFGANEEDAISDFYGILSGENKMTGESTYEKHDRH